MTSRRFEDDDRHEMRQMRRIERERIVPIISRRVEREVDSRNYEELAAARRELDELKQSRVDEEQYKLKQRLAAEKREKEIQELKMRAEYEKQKERNIYELKQQEFKEQKLRQRTAEVYDLQQRKEIAKEFKLDREQLQTIERSIQPCIEKLSNIQATFQSLNSKASATSKDSASQKLSRQVDDFNFRLEVWKREANFGQLRNLRSQDFDSFFLVRQAQKRLDNLVKKLEELSSTAEASDLVETEIDVSETESEDVDTSDIESVESTSRVVKSLDEPIGERIRDVMAAIESDMRDLSLFAEPLQDGIIQNDSLKTFVMEGQHYFGSEEALKTYAVNPKLSGPKALEAARKIATQKIPTYVKVHKDHVDIESLDFFSLPWETDKTDHNYFIILKELSTQETDTLFRHTRLSRELAAIREGRSL